MAKKNGAARSKRSAPASPVAKKRSRKEGDSESSSFKKPAKLGKQASYTNTIFKIINLFQDILSTLHDDCLLSVLSHLDL